ncbi:nuclear pore complex protein Nup50-like [Clavelina lepadiformis]|uniref:nuclear pore complex protein Nup50-like n=1 Tax=Clavelina lepadiformis TaxID=159417 RepID=UPI004042F634
MSKRGAEKYLTDQNWEEEDEPEDAGRFQPADEGILKNRTFKKAKRRMVPQASAGSGAFAGFGGLASSGKPATTSNGFKGFSLPPSAGSSKPFSFQPETDTTAGKSSSSARIKAIMTSKTPAPAKDETDEKKSLEYDRHLAALNRSVSQWITDHVERNPLCDLSPIFRDYQKHLEDLDEKFGAETSPDGTQSSLPKEEEEASDDQVKKEPGQSSTSEVSKPPSTPPKNPLSSLMTKPTTASPFKGFGSFQSSSSSSSGFTGFQFSSNMVAGASTSAQSEAKQPVKGDGEEEYVPPKVESEMVEEEDAFYTKKCKLFYLKDGSFKEKGVGFLHLKPVASSSKTQLIVRADTSLGNLLLNIVLDPVMPMKKQGKNSVAITCVPNPPIDEKNPNEVVPMLIRVKTSEDADALEELLNKKKQETD